MSLQQTIYQQFKKPSGFLGSLAGRLMASRNSNRERNRWLLEILELRDDDDVLEIGFGPGLGIEGALRRVTKGTVTGIDHSRTMFTQASSRNAEAIREGRASLYVGDVAMIDATQKTFDHIYSSNVVQFWEDPVAVFAKLRQHLKPGGSIATMYMPRHKGAIGADALAMGEKLEAWLRQTGFSQIKIATRDIDGMTTVCAMAIEQDK